MPNRKLLYFSDIYGSPSEISATDTATLGKLALTGIAGVGIDAGGFLISNVANPVSPGDAVNKAYTDAISQGITQIPSVRVMANSNQTLTGLPTIDGVQLVAGDRILLTAQTNPTQNGVFQVGTGSWTRPTGANGVSDWTTGRSASGLAMFVREGSAFADQGYVCITDGNPLIDSSPVSFTQYTGLGEVVAGAGLIKQAASGNQLAVNLAPQSGLQFTNNALDHLLDPAGALSKSAAGVAIKPNANATVAVDAQGLRVLGVPAQFTLAGVATDPLVTAPNLATLVSGTNSYADALHQHTNVLQARAQVDTHKTGSALNIGDPVQWANGTSDTLQKCDAASINTAQCIGIAMTTASANANVAVLKRGVAVGVFNGGTPGAPVFLAVGGGLTSTPATGIAQFITRIGYVKNASGDIDVGCQTIGQRSATA